MRLHRTDCGRLDELFKRALQPSRDDDSVYRVVTAGRDLVCLYWTFRTKTNWRFASHLPHTTFDCTPKSSFNRCCSTTPPTLSYWHLYLAHHASPSCIIIRLLLCVWYSNNTLFSYTTERTIPILGFLWYSNAWVDRIIDFLKNLANHGQKAIDVGGVIEHQRLPVRDSHVSLGRSGVQLVRSSAIVWNAIIAPRVISIFAPLSLP